MPREELAPSCAVMRPFSPGAAAEDARQAGGVEHELCAVERERRLGAFVLVHVALAETVAATAGREVVERPAETVASEEPLEGALRAGAVLGIAGDDERGELCLDEGRRVERLLVAGARRGLVRAAPFVAGEPQEPVREPALVAEPGERLQAGGDRVLAPERVPPTISACGRRALS